MKDLPGVSELQDAFAERLMGEFGGPSRSGLLEGFGGQFRGTVGFGTAINVSPALMMIGSGRSTQPPLHNERQRLTFLKGGVTGPQFSSIPFSVLDLVEGILMPPLKWFLSFMKTYAVMTSQNGLRWVPTSVHGILAWIPFERTTVKPVISVMLFVELGESSPRQRTIFRRELLRCGWSSVGNRGLVFAIQMSDVKSDRQVMRRTTRHVHAALQTAEISDWSANCVCSDQPELAKALKRI